MHTLESVPHVERCSALTVNLTETHRHEGPENANILGLHPECPLVAFHQRSSSPSAVRLHTFFKACKTKFYVLLLVIFVIHFQTSAATPVTRSGRRLLLHTRQSRERDHQLLIQQLRSQQPPNSVHRHHHMHLRSVSDPVPVPVPIQVPVPVSVPNMSDNQKRQCELCQYLQSAKCDIDKDFAEIYGSLQYDQLKTFYNDKETQYLSSAFPVKHSYVEALPKIDVHKTFQPTFDHLNQPITEQQLNDELVKVYHSLRVIHEVLEKSLIFQHNTTVATSSLMATPEDYKYIREWIQTNPILKIKENMKQLRKKITAEDQELVFDEKTYDNLFLGVRECMRFLKYQKALYIALSSHCPAKYLATTDCRDSEQYI